MTSASPEVARLQRGRDAVSAFAHALRNLLALCEPVPASYGNSQWVPRDGMQDRVLDLVGEVQRLGGRAASAFQRVGVLIEYRPPGTWATQPVNPALVWETLLRADPMGDPNLFLSSCNTALGRFEDLLDEADADAEAAPQKKRSAPGMASRTRRTFGLSSRWLAEVGTNVFVTVVGGVIVIGLGIWWFGVHG